MKDWFAKAGGHAAYDAFDDTPDGVAIGADGLDVLDHGIDHVGITSADDVRLDLLLCDGVGIDVRGEVLNWDMFRQCCPIV